MIRKHANVDSIYALSTETLLTMSSALPHSQATAAIRKQYQILTESGETFAYSELLDVICSTLVNFFTHKVGIGEDKHRELYGALKDARRREADGRTSMLGLLQGDRSWRQPNMKFITP